MDGCNLIILLYWMTQGNLAEIDHLIKVPYKNFTIIVPPMGYVWFVNEAEVLIEQSGAF